MLASCLKSKCVRASWACLQAEIVEQVKVLASSNETAKLHVQRRATAAHLVAAANPTSHRQVQQHCTGLRSALLGD